MLSLEDTQESILAAVTSSFAQRVVEQAIPNTQTVLRNDLGRIEPYIAVQFGDLSESSSRGLIGPRGYSYNLPIYTQVIAGDPKTARRLANKLIRVLLGESYPWSGNVRKRPGGGMWPIVQSDGSTEAYMYPASFSVLVQFHYDPAI